MAVIKALEENQSTFTEWRHKIHSNPETAFEEIDTGNFVAEKLESFGIEVHRGLAKTAVIGTLEGKEKSSQSIGLRADMDALDLDELNTFEHKSQVDGKMHACGHDGHTTMLLAAAKYLSETRNFKGKVHFYFQPAEENFGGANVMIKEGLFDKFPVDMVFGMHNWPGANAKVFHVKPGALLAANARFEIKIQGKGAHAAMPNQGKDSILMSSNLIMALQSVASRVIAPLDSVVVSVTQVHGGSAWNVLPDEVIIRGSLRALTNEVKEKAFAAIREITNGICSAYGGTAIVDIVSGYPVTFNDEVATKVALKAAQKTIGENKVITKFASTMGSEDFSFMLQEVPGCYVLLGNDKSESTDSGTSPCMLHNPYYDFNDELIPVGASYFVNLVENGLD
ncbi:MAG: peptidase M20 [Planctomycetota bacterium]|nr:MAG: peptidase M20 [Planctomycetota bacterium]